MYKIAACKSQRGVVSVGRWLNSLEARWNEWAQVEEAMSRTLAGRSILRVAGPRTPRLNSSGVRTVPAADLTRVEGTYEAGLACFCLGELTAEGRAEFLNNLHGRLKEGATAVLADRRSEGCGAAFELHELFAPVGTKLDVQVGRTFWWVRYELR
jgi:hypothetical protein